MARGGPLFESDSNKCRGVKTGPLFESPPRPLLKSGLQPLGRYDTHQETIRCILYPTQDWNGLGRSHYSSRTQINAGSQYGATIRVTSWLKSGLQLLGRYGTDQESISRRPEQVYLPSDPRLEWPGEGPLFEFNLNKCWAKR